MTDTANGLNPTGDNVRITGCKFRSLQLASATPDIFVYAENINGFEMDHCEVGRGRINIRSTTSTTKTRCSIHHNVLNGDYTGSSGADITNIIDVRGITDVAVTDNTWSAINWYRVLKVSAAIGDSSPIDSGRSRRVIVSRNLLNVSAVSGQQCMDFFIGTEETIVSDNIFDVSGSMVGVVHWKPDGTSEATGYVNNIIVANNLFKLGSGVVSPIFISGAWGTPGFTVPNKCAVAGNIIEEAGTSTSAAIVVKGMNQANITCNQRQAPALAFSKFIDVSNNQLTVVADNKTSFGNIRVLGNGSTPNGTVYSNQNESVVITGNILDDFNSQGGISLESLTSCEEMTIADNHIRNQTDTASIAGPVFFTSATITDLNIHDNTANFANVSKHVPSGAPTVTRYRSQSNSWEVAAISLASSAALVLPAYGSTFFVTGTTNVTSMTVGRAGRQVTLIFTGALTFTDGGNLRLAGNFSTTADDTITLMSDGTNWYEMSRSTN